MHYLQTDCIKWRQERRKLLTASSFGKVCKMRPTTSCKSIVKTLLYTENIFAKAIIWGRNNEERARQELATILNIEILDCGLIVNKKWPYLGASPDGHGSDNSIIEIKCPYTAKELPSEKAKAS